MKYQAIVFDLDGVLIDSKECMRLCWEKVQNETKISIPFDDYFSYIGKPFEIILLEIGVPKNIWAIVESIYFEEQQSQLHEIKQFKEIDTLLNKLREKYILGLVTSKKSKPTGNILKKFNWNFSQVITPDNCVRGKPFPDPLLYFAAYEQLDPRKCMYVGDMKVDKMAAKQAGFDFIRAGWGYQQFTAKSANSPQDLYEIIESS